MFESESNWSFFNTDLIDYVNTESKIRGLERSVSVCVSCGNPSGNPSSDHFFQAEDMVLCELCYLDYNLMQNN